MGSTCLEPQLVTTAHLKVCDGITLKCDRIKGECDTISLQGLIEQIFNPNCKSISFLTLQSAYTTYYIS